MYCLINHHLFWASALERGSKVWGSRAIGGNSQSRHIFFYLLFGRRKTRARTSSEQRAASTPIAFSAWGVHRVWRTCRNLLHPALLHLLTFPFFFLIHIFLGGRVTQKFTYTLLFFPLLPLRTCIQIAILLFCASSPPLLAGFPCDWDGVGRYRIIGAKNAHIPFAQPFLVW